MKKKIRFDDLVDREQIQLEISKLAANSLAFAKEAKKCMAPCSLGDLMGHCECYPKTTSQ
ncbi:hypothetical protein GCM10028810_01990 [Spirosoma litoris]